MKTSLWISSCSEALLILYLAIKIKVLYKQFYTIYKWRQIESAKEKKIVQLFEQANKNKSYLNGVNKIK